MTRVFQSKNSFDGSLACLTGLSRPHVIVYSLPTWEAWDVLDLLKANSYGELEIISIVGWLGIILVKGSSFVVSKIAANSLPWVGQGCFRSNLSADRLACVTGLSTLLHMIVYYLSTINSTEFWSILRVLISIRAFSSCWVNDCRQASISLGTWEYVNRYNWNVEKEI